MLIQFIPHDLGGRFFLGTYLQSSPQVYVLGVFVADHVHTAIRDECFKCGFSFVGEPWLMALRDGKPIYTVSVTEGPTMTGITSRSAYDANADLPVWLRVLSLLPFVPSAQHRNPTLVFA